LLGGLVTIIAVVGIIPYISLQLKSISANFEILSRYPEVSAPLQIGQTPVLNDTAFYVAVLLALFAILFGTRHLDATEHHEGLVAAIAFESVIKLVAFLAVGIFVTYGIYNGGSVAKLEANGVTALGDEGGINNRGLYNVDTAEARVNSSQLTGSGGNGLVMETTSGAVYLGVSQLVPDANRMGGTLTCYGVYDSSYVAYTCP
jgi:hypothetical protein